MWRRSMTEYKRILCLACKTRFEDDADFYRHPCDRVFKMKDGKLSAEVSKALKMKSTRWGRFIDKILSRDIGFGLACAGLIIANAVCVIHFKFSLKEIMVEGFGLGLAIPRLLSWI